MSFFSDNKSYIKVGVISGVVFTLIMVGFNYFMEREFLIWKTAFYLVGFGGFNGYMAYRRVKKEEERRRRK